MYAAYETELKFLREMALEFARDFPKVAGRLGIDGIESTQCADPYVERLLEGAAFLAARVQLQLGLEQPRFTEQLLHSLYPGYLTPTASMAMVEFRPLLQDAGLATGYRLPRGTVLKSPLGRDDTTACEFRTAHSVTLWPLELREARYYGTAAGLGLLGVRSMGQARAGLRLSLKITAGLKASEIELDQLDLHLSGADPLPHQTYEHVHAHALGLVVRAKDGSGEIFLPRQHIEPLGFRDEEALLPNVRRTFSGYRLLQEYFSMPERYLFVRLAGLRRALAALETSEIEVIFLFDRPVTSLEQLAADNLRLFATPAVNLIEKRADRINLTDRVPEYHLVVDRSRPMDYEIIDVISCEGFGTRAEPEMSFHPFYSTTESTWHARDRAYFTIRRDPRVWSARQKRNGPRSSYVGHEVFLSLSDARAAPFRSDLRQLECRVLCTNRDLPLQMVSRGKADFLIDSGGPIETIRLLGKPTSPREALTVSDGDWRLISQLSLNYTSLLDSSATEGAEALRELLTLYARDHDPAEEQQIRGVRSVVTRPIVARLPGEGPVAVGRGIEICVTLDDESFKGAGVLRLAAVLDEFFARYVSINSFTQTVLRTVSRGEIMRWPARTGRRPII